MRCSVIHWRRSSCPGAHPATKADKPAADQAAKKTDATAAKGDEIAGLPTEKDQVSYMIGMQMAKPLVLAKDDVDVDVIAKAIKTALSGGKPLLTEEQAQKIAERLRTRVASHDMEVAGHITISLGVAHWGADATSIAAVLKEADKALYDAKSQGRNCVVVALG